MVGVARVTVVMYMVLAVVLGLSVGLEAQSEGDTAISDVIQGTVTIVGSKAYIDASPFYYASTIQDTCGTINSILTSSSYPKLVGAVVDARGILPNLVNNSYPPLTCSSDPFTGVTAPSTILLPATSIQISTFWSLPSNTRIIGEGPAHNNYTEVRVEPSSFTGTAMVQMGPTSGSATGVAIEHIRFDGLGAKTQTVVDGIDNSSAGDGSYVNDVGCSNAYFQVAVAGLNINTP